jgi:hypothetical protein
MEEHMNQRYAQPLVTEEERRAYGDDLLSVVERKAMEVMSPTIAQLRNENQDLRQRVFASEARDIYAVLDQEIPNWREINVHPTFVNEYLQQVDPYSSAVRANLLKQGFGVGDANRVLAFFRGFLNEHPQFKSGKSSSSAPRQPRSPSERSFANDAPVDNRDIDRFYARVRQGYYNGREEQKTKEESDLHRAIHERGVVKPFLR